MRPLQAMCTGSRAWLTVPQQAVCVRDLGPSCMWPVSENEPGGMSRGPCGPLLMRLTPRHITMLQAATRWVGHSASLARTLAARLRAQQASLLLQVFMRGSMCSAAPGVSLPGVVSLLLQLGAKQLWVPRGRREGVPWGAERAVRAAVHGQRCCRGGHQLPHPDHLLYVSRVMPLIPPLALIPVLARQRNVVACGWSSVQLSSVPPLDSAGAPAPALRLSHRPAPALRLSHAQC